MLTVDSAARSVSHFPSPSSPSYKEQHFRLQAATCPTHKLFDMSASFELDDYVTKKDRDAPATDINVLTASISANTSQHHIHRRLTPRHLQLITIAGGIGCESSKLCDLINRR